MRPISTFSIRLLLVCFILPLSFLKGSAQGFVWAQGLADSMNGNSGINLCTTDANNNGYFVGSFDGTTDFDPSYGVVNITANSDNNMFILKKDSAGNLLWMKFIQAIHPNDTGSCRGYGIRLDNSGNIYICGSFNDSFDFDPGPGVHMLGAYSSGNYFGSHGFVLKLSPVGDFIWVKDIGNTADLSGVGIGYLKMDATNNIYFSVGIVGNTPCTIDVDPGPGIYNVPCQTNSDFLIEKLDSAGNFIWAKQISGPGGQGVSALALDTMSNIYITGSQDGTADFDPGTGVANVSGNNIFIAKYDSAGNYQWVGSIAAGWGGRSNGIATDTFGSLVVVGYWMGSSVDLDPGPGVYNLTSGSTHNEFILKLKSDGGFSWAKTNYDNGQDVIIDGLGSIYETGGASIQKRDSSGNVIWSETFSGYFGNYFEYVNTAAITLDQADNVYIVGSYTWGGYDYDPGPGVYNLPGNSAGGLILKLCANSLDIAITASNDTICPQGEIVELTTPAISGANYTWTCNGVVVGTNSNTINTSMPGVYKVYTDLGCPSASIAGYIYDCNGYLYDQAGVGENIKSAGVEVYPNPTHDKLTIQTNFDNYTVSIINTLGQVVKKTRGSKNAVVDVSQYNAGVYYLRIENADGEVVNRKFVVQH